MASNAQAESSTPAGKSGTQTLQEFAERDWSASTLLTGRKQKRWLAEDYSELYVEEAGDWMDTDAEYKVKYRDGRLGPSDLYAEFDDLEEAVEYAEQLIEGETDLEELR
ncbi:MAG: hypothetical protein ABEJ36_02185 [Candidatus Nanosalina sp.]